MLSNLPIAGVCPKCAKEKIVCRFNFFDRGDLQVHAWEHKCSDCGWRETKAYRSDDVSITEPIEKRGICPFCGRKGTDVKK